MKTLAVSFTFIVLTLAACVQQSVPSEPCTLPEEDFMILRSMEVEHEQQVLDAAWESMTDDYAVDVLVLFPNQQEIRGREALRAIQESFPPISEYDLRFDEVGGCGDVAYIKAAYSMAMQIGDGDPVRDVGKFLQVLRKTSSGSWEVTLDMFNSDLPVASTE